MYRSSHHFQLSIHQLSRGPTNVAECQFWEHFILLVAGPPPESCLCMTRAVLLKENKSLAELDSVAADDGRRVAGCLQWTWGPLAVPFFIIAPGSCGGYVCKCRLVFYHRLSITREQGPRGDRLPYITSGGCLYLTVNLCNASYTLTVTSLQNFGQRWRVVAENICSKFSKMRAPGVWAENTDKSAHYPGRFSNINEFFSSCCSTEASWISLRNAMLSFSLYCANEPLFIC